MDSNFNPYATASSIGEKVSSKNYIEPGVHKVTIDKVELLDISTDNYQGQVADIHFVDEKGATLNHRIFPYKYNTSFKDKDGNVISENTQFEEYFQKLNHIFYKACNEDIFKVKTNGAQSFGDYIVKVNSCVAKANGGKPFWMLVIADKKTNFSRPAMWKSGCCETFNEGVLSTLKFDIEKHGKKAPEPQQEHSTLNELPFDINK